MSIEKQFKVVPIDATPAMIAAGLAAINLAQTVGMPEYSADDAADMAWAAMVDASPAPTLAAPPSNEEEAVMALKLAAIALHRFAALDDIDAAYTTITMDEPKVFVAVGTLAAIKAALPWPALALAGDVQPVAPDQVAELFACTAWAERHFRHAREFTRGNLNIVEAAWLERARRATRPQIIPAAQPVLFVRQMDLDNNRGTLVASPNSDDLWSVPVFLAAPPQPLSDAKPVAWANWKVGTTSYVPYRTRADAEGSVRKSAIAATQDGPYQVVELFDRAAPPQLVAQPAPAVLDDATQDALNAVRRDAAGGGVATCKQIDVLCDWVEARVAAVPAAAQKAAHRIAGLGSITNDGSGFVLLRFIDEDAEQAFMRNYRTSVDCRDMPKWPDAAPSVAVAQDARSEPASVQAIIDAAHAHGRQDMRTPIGKDDFSFTPQQLVNFVRALAAPPLPAASPQEQSEAEQRAKMAARGAGRPTRASTADFDLPAAGDAVEAAPQEQGAAPLGASNCPICGEGQPHVHTGAEVAQHGIQLVRRNKDHWHLVNVNHATATGSSYYPAIYSGEGEELGYVQGDVAHRLINAHNRSVDAAPAFPEVPAVAPAAEGQQGTLSIERIVKNAILGNSHPSDEGYLMFLNEDEVTSAAWQAGMAISEKMDFTPEQIINIATTSRNAEPNNDGGYIFPISFARAILAAAKKDAQ